MPTIKTYGLNGIGPSRDYLQKLIEEHSELLKAETTEEVEEEGMDVIEVVVNYMAVMGCNIKRAEERHLQKMEERWG